MVLSFAIGQLSREGLFCRAPCNWVADAGLHMEELLTSMSQKLAPSGEQVWPIFALSVSGEESLGENTCV